MNSNQIATQKLEEHKQLSLVQSETQMKQRVIDNNAQRMICNELLPSVPNQTQYIEDKYIFFLSQSNKQSIQHWESITASKERQLPSDWLSKDKSDITPSPSKILPQRRLLSYFEESEIRDDSLKSDTTLLLDDCSNLRGGIRYLHLQKFSSPNILKAAKGKVEVYKNHLCYSISEKPLRTLLLSTTGEVISESYNSTQLCNGTPLKIFSYSVFGYQITFRKDQSEVQVSPFNEKEQRQPFHKLFARIRNRMKRRKCSPLDLYCSLKEGKFHINQNLARFLVAFEIPFQRSQIRSFSESSFTLSQSGSFEVESVVEQILFQNSPKKCELSINFNNSDFQSRQDIRRLLVLSNEHKITFWDFIWALESHKDKIQRIHNWMISLIQ